MSYNGVTRFKREELLSGAQSCPLDESAAVAHNAAVIAENERVLSRIAAITTTSLQASEAIDSKLRKLEAQRSDMQERFRRVEENNACLFTVALGLVIGTATLSTLLLVRRFW